MGDQRRGVWFGAAAYLMWGLFPLYWPHLRPAGAVEILAHRMVWSLVFMVAVLAVLRRWRALLALARDPRLMARICVAGVFISVNWGLYIWGVNHGQVVETSLGYFINPLVFIVVGVVVLHERLRAAQWAAVGLGAAAVVVLAAAYGRVPWLSLVLAASFTVYGLVKKAVALPAAESLTAETALMFAPAAGYLAWLSATGEGTFASAGAWHAVLLAGAGVVTAVPLLCFGAAAVSVPLSVLGMLQYLGPVLQFACGVWIYHEAMPASRWAGFAFVWAALAVLTWDLLRQARRTRAAAAPATPAAPAAPVAAAAPVAPVVPAPAAGAAGLPRSPAGPPAAAGEPARPGTPGD